MLPGSANNADVSYRSGDATIPLFWIDEDGVITVQTVDQTGPPSAPRTMLALTEASSQVEARILQEPAYVSSADSTTRMHEHG